MTEADIDRRLGAMLRQDMPKPDSAFAEQVMNAVRIETQFAAARRRAWRRLAIDAAAAAALGLTFFLLSQEQPPAPDGIIPLQGPVMAGLVMLALWGIVALPISGSRHALAP